MKLEDLCDEYTGPRRPGWLVLEDEEVQPQAILATRYYIGYGRLESFNGRRPSLDEIDVGTEVTASEWAIISPLFHLYVELENALRLEASRAAGLEVYGRQVSEIKADIRTQEIEELPQRAFSPMYFEVS